MSVIKTSARKKIRVLKQQRFSLYVPLGLGRGRLSYGTSYLTKMTGMLPEPNKTFYQIFISLMESIIPQSEIKMSTKLKLFISNIVENVLNRVIKSNISGGYRHGKTLFSSATNS